MKYPLKWYHRLGREMLCTLLTHRTKSSWHRRADYAWAVTQDDLPYGRWNSSNPYYEYSETWEYRCRRCRREWRHTQPQALRTQLFWGVWHGGALALFNFQHYRWWQALVMAPVEFFTQFNLHQEWMWPTLRFAPSSLTYWLYEKFD